MNTEYEITFENIDHNILRQKIILLWGICIQEKTLMKRVVFKHDDKKLKNSYFRVRDEWNKITCTYKTIFDSSEKLDINSVKEIETEIQDFEAMKNIFLETWLKQTAYQETYRETWKIWSDIEFMLDEWPWLKPFIEIEGKNETIVREYSKKLGFSYNLGVFWAVDELYFREHWIPHDITNNTSEITFQKPLTK